MSEEKSNNYANIEQKYKFIVTMKYYQKGLPAIAESMDKQGKKQLENKRKYFLIDVFTFKPSIHFSLKRKKQTIKKQHPQVKTFSLQEVSDFHNLDSVPEDRPFQNKGIFFSAMKQNNTSDHKYDSYTYLYLTLKMGNLSYLNDLYNFQDVAILFKIMENRFEFIHKKYGLNPKMCNSAIALSGCTET